MAFINGAKEKTYYLLAVLNSSLVKFWMKKNVPEYGSTGYRFSNLKDWIYELLDYYIEQVDKAECKEE